MKLHTLLFVIVSLLSSMVYPAQASENSFILAADTFGCINEMQPVRGFFVDNLNKNDLNKTLAVAKAGKGEYPAGSVVQLVPTEVMVKQPKGTSPVTNDWEFIELAVSAKGNKITAQGFDNVVNKFGGNCLDCHKKANPEFDMICETGHGCDPIPITKEMIAVIQKTDPRCKTPVNLSDKEMVILQQLQKMFASSASESR